MVLCKGMLALGESIGNLLEAFYRGLPRIVLRHGDNVIGMQVGPM